MIIGSYPCCDGSLCLAMPAKTPAFAQEDCPHCGAKVWHRFSRIETMSWTEADFLAEHVVDHDTHQIHAKPGTPAAAFDRLQRDPGLTTWYDQLIAKARASQP